MNSVIRYIQKYKNYKAYNNTKIQNTKIQEYNNTTIQNYKIQEYTTIPNN